MAKVFIIARNKSKSAGTSEALDVAARHLVFKLYDAARDSRASSWQPVRGLGEVAATASRAVERGWVVVRNEGNGRTKELWAALTQEGRAVGRKGLR
jgi:hypothetical protein